MTGLPARDGTRPQTEQGLYKKFEVRRTDGSDAPGGKHDGCEYFVLDLTHDPFAPAAVAAYAKAAEATHPQLALDICARYSLGAHAAALPAAPGAFELNEHTLEILGRPNFACGGLARTLRLRGDEIAEKAEHEQAAVLAFCLGHYFTSGTGWREAAEAELSAIVDEARRRYEQSAPAAPSAARDLTGPTVGGATEAGAIVQDGGAQ